MEKYLNKIFVFLTAFSLIFLLVKPGSTEAASQPTLQSLEKNYNDAVQSLFYWSSLKDQFSLGALLQDVATKAYEEYKSLTTKREYSKSDFIDDVLTISKIAIKTGSKTVTLPMKIIVYKKYIKASFNLANAERELRKYYPYNAKCIIDGICNHGSGGGGASRSF